MAYGSGVGRQATARGRGRKRERSLKAVRSDEGRREEAIGGGCERSSAEGGEEGRRARGRRAETREEERVGKEKGIHGSSTSTREGNCEREENPLSLSFGGGREKKPTMRLFLQGKFFLTAN